MATFDGLSHPPRIEHVASHDVLDLDSERSERRVDPFRSTNEEAHVVAGSQHRRCGVGANKARCSRDQDRMT
jgi:hypothetical protein